MSAPLPDGDPLTADEVAELPDGEPIVVTWTGGNGPHPYVVAVDRYGDRYAALNTNLDDRLRWYNRLSFVGQERFHTRVWRAR